MSPSLGKIAIVEKVSLDLDVVEREFGFSVVGTLDWDSLMRTNYRQIRKSKSNYCIINKAAQLLSVDTED